MLSATSCRTLISKRLFQSIFLRALGTAENTSANLAIVEDDISIEKEAEIEKKRNKSNLSEAHRNIVNGQRPYNIPISLVHLTVKYNRKIFGKYGSQSGVNPSLCWPSQKEIEEKREYEKVAFPFTIEQMMQAAAEKQKAEREFILEREKTIVSRMEKIAQWKKDLNNRKSKKMAEAEAAKAKKERLVEEVRRHFGFKLDPRDERFQEMLTKREKEQKKLEKQAKKEAKEKEVIAKIQQKNVEIIENTKSTE